MSGYPYDDPVLNGLAELMMRGWAERLNIKVATANRSLPPRLRTAPPVVPGRRRRELFEDDLPF